MGKTGKTGLELKTELCNVLLYASPSCIVFVADTSRMNLAVLG